MGPREEASVLYREPRWADDPVSDSESAIDFWLVIAAIVITVVAALVLL